MSILQTEWIIIYENRSAVETVCIGISYFYLVFFYYFFYCHLLKKYNLNWTQHSKYGSFNVSFEMVSGIIFK